MTTLANTTTPTDRPCVHVVDDDPGVRQGLRFLFETIGHTVRTYSSVADFLAVVEPDPRGCLVLDVRMPGESGLDLLDRADARGLRLPIVMLTGHGDVPMAVRAMKAGAVEFLSKPCADQVLIEAIARALSLDERQREQRRARESARAKLGRLTPREREVLEHIVAGKSNKQTGATLGIAEKTVEVHRASLMTKLACQTLPDLVRAWILATGNLQPSGAAPHAQAEHAA